MTVHIDIRQTDAAGMTDIQQWMLSVIAGDIQADVQQGHLTWQQAADVLERLATIIRQRHTGAAHD